MIRWLAVVHYRTSLGGILEVDIPIEELSELHDKIERGPDWNTIDRIEIRLARVATPGLTVEEAARR